MSEKIELIEAKDLPMTEEEDVTVLCVGADGEMKRRDAGSFGMKASDLAELPTTEAEEVDVICVNAEGNLCRKPGASFGGGGGGSDFCVIFSAIDNTYRYISGDYDAIREKLNTKQPIMMGYFEITENGADPNNPFLNRHFWDYTVRFSIPEWSEPENSIRFDISTVGTAWYLLPDNTITFHVYD